ncbi:FAD-dependent monooxygenase [Mycolicibacterium pyrenivorans]|uniref:FAD-dependent monooxygenase n=1 Tax=Mycolicibacterium pyrenivorans TaxID=187102 RepID=UPI0021F32977|nr:FAD-dependent monooxygenase [Mycolicibacterium pyrenivorans]
MTATTADTSVLIAGAGPVGLTAAIELARRGIDFTIVDPLLDPPRYAKAVGVQPRTLEIFEGMGVLRRIRDAGIEMNGQLVYVNGQEVARMEFPVPADVPFAFFSIPQYETERILREELALHGVRVQRGCRVTGFEQDADGVTATLTSDGRERRVRADYLIGADGAHSIVRKTLGLTFEGAAFEEQYMLGDVEVDWSMPRGYGIRSMHQTDGTTDDLLVCIPLPGRGRYRMSMLVPDELAAHGPDGKPRDGVEHGFTGGRAPELRHIQAVVDRLAPEPAVARDLRWSSVFKISHRIVDSYGWGRVFVAGDAAHIHPPTGAQGMNTGIQDAHNLAWKLALAVSGVAAPGLLDSYDAERRPVGEEIVARTVRSARDGIGADSADPDYVIRREAQLLIDFAGSPLVTSGSGAAPAATSGPGAAPAATSGSGAAGKRAPDARGLTRAAVTAPIRLFSLLSARDHTLLLYAGDIAGGVDVAEYEHAAAAAVRAAHGALDVYLVAATGVDATATVLPLIVDDDDDFRRAYGATGAAAFLVRPDGYVAYTHRGEALDADALVSALRTTFA